MNKANIQITARVLTYNGGTKVLSTLESLKLQTYPYKDLVIADDASTDNGYTVSIVEKWIKHNKQFFTNVQFIKNPRNLGIVRNIRNASLHAKGDILFGLGQGDLCYGPQTFEVLANEIQRRRDNGEDDPYFWLGEYMGYKIENNEFKEIQLYKDLPNQHRLLITNPYKALKHNLARWEIGGIGIVYHRKFYDKDIYPLFNAPQNWEDGPIFIWALVEKHKIGILNFKIRWYEIGTGVSWETRPNILKNVIDIIFFRNNSTFYKKDKQAHDDFSSWLTTLHPKDSAMTIFLKNYCSHLNNYGNKNIMNRLKYVFKKFCGICRATIRQYQSRIIYKIFYKETGNNPPFDINSFK